MTAHASVPVREASSAVTNARVLARRYHDIVTVWVIFAYFSGYSMFLARGGNDRPMVWLVLTTALALPLLVTVSPWRALTRSPVVAWCLLYLIISLAGFGISSRSTVVAALLQDIVVATVTLLLLIIVLSTTRAVHLARVCVGACVIAAVVLNVYDLLNPGKLSIALGRPAGLYANPNSSATAIILGLILVIDILPRRVKGLFVIAAGGGVLLTMSRAGIAGYALVLILLIMGRRVRVRSLLTSLALIVVVLGVLVVGTSKGRQLQGIARFLVTSGLLARVSDVGKTAEGGDGSAKTRVLVIEQAWDLYSQHPVVGAGLGTTTVWRIKQSTHNIYFRHLAEHGSIGFILYPLLLVAAVWGAQGRMKLTALMAVVYLLMNAMFTHNVLEERFYLAGYALLGAMSWESLAQMVSRRQAAGEAIASPG